MSELDYWNGRLLKGAISRREFMGRAAALGASSVAISAMLASADAIAAETPKKGGVLRLGLGGGSTTDSIDVTLLQQLGDDRHRPRPVQRHRRMGPGRQTASGTRRELRADRTARRTGSSICARGSSSRTARSSPPTTQSIRSTCIGATPSPAAQSRSSRSPTSRSSTSTRSRFRSRRPDADLPYALTDYHVH